MSGRTSHTVESRTRSLEWPRLLNGGREADFDEARHDYRRLRDKHCRRPDGSWIAELELEDAASNEAGRGKPGAETREEAHAHPLGDDDDVSERSALLLAASSKLMLFASCLPSEPMEALLRVHSTNTRADTSRPLTPPARRRARALPGRQRQQPHPHSRSHPLRLGNLAPRSPRLQARNARRSLSPPHRPHPRLLSRLPGPRAHRSRRLPPLLPPRATHRPALLPGDHRQLYG